MRIGQEKMLLKEETDGRNNTDYKRNGNVHHGKTPRGQNFRYCFSHHCFRRSGFNNKSLLYKVKLVRRREGSFNLHSPKIFSQMHAVSHSVSFETRIIIMQTTPLLIQRKELVNHFCNSIFLVRATKNKVGFCILKAKEVTKYIMLTRESHLSATFSGKSCLDLVDRLFKKRLHCCLRLRRPTTGWKKNPASHALKGFRLVSRKLRNFHPFSAYETLYTGKMKMFDRSEAKATDKQGDEKMVCNFRLIIHLSPVVVGHRHTC